MPCTGVVYSSMDNTNEAEPFNVVTNEGDQLSTEKGPLSDDEQKSLLEDLYRKTLEADAVVLPTAYTTRR